MVRFVVASLLLVFLPAFAFAGAGLTYQGRLVRSNGEPVENNLVQFKIQVRTPGNENCLLYEETSSRDMTGTSGMFAISINDGTATSVNTEPFTLDRAFQNRGTFSFAGGKCALGSAYTPNATDGRKLVVQFNDGTFAGWETLPAQAVNYVPMSMESLTVGGFSAGHFLRVLDGSGNPVSLSPWTQANYTTLTDLVGGTSTLYRTSAVSIPAADVSGNISGNAAGFTGSLAGDVTGTQGATSVVKLRGRDIDTTPPANGQVLKWNATSSRWEPSPDLSGATGTLNTVSGAGAIQITGTSTDPIVGVQDASTSQKGVVQLATSGQSAAGVVVQGNDSRLSDARTPTAHTHAVDEITSAAGKYFGYKPNNVACASNEILKWDSANSRWICGVQNITDIRSNLSGAFLTGTTCSAGQALVYSAITDTMSCSAISLSSSQVTSALTYTPVNKAGDTMTGALAVPANGLTVGTSQLVAAGGNVGIGTTTPNALLDVNGTMRVSQICDSSGANCKTISGGWGAGGSVTSVAVTAPSIFSVTGSPITTSGTVAMSLANQNANLVFAGPTTGSATPTFRNLNISDLRSSVSGSFLTGGACGSGQALVYNSPADTISCSTITLTNSQVTTALGSASASASGYLTSTDWNTFNGKQAALGFTPVNKTGDTMTGALVLPSNGLTVGTSQLVVGSAGVGIGTATPAVSLDLSQKTDALALPRGTAAQQPGSPGVGWIRYNTDSGGVEVFNGSTWGGVTAGGTAVSPPGMVSAFPTATCPAGWLEANGAAISRTTYASVFTAIGTIYGAGDGSTTFNLPDYRGYFLRGWNHGASVDSNAGSRTNRGDGTTGDSVGTKQTDAMQGHRHGTSGSLYGPDFATPGIGSSGNIGNAVSVTVGDPSTDGTNGAPRTSAETRPKNINVIYCVSTASAPATTVSSSGTGTTGTLAVWSSSTALGTSPVVISGSNVGIGTSAPGATLDIAGTARLSKQSSAPFTCDAAHDGVIAQTSRYTMCTCRSDLGWVTTSDGSSACSWTATIIVVNGSGRKWGDGTYATSCNGYRNPAGNYSYAGLTGDGTYTIDPDGAGSATPFDVTCDMTNGGWTVIVASPSTTLTDLSKFGSTTNISGTFYTDATYGIGWGTNDNIEKTFAISYPSDFTQMTITYSGFYDTPANSLGSLVIADTSCQGSAWVCTFGTAPLNFTDGSSTAASQQALVLNGVGNTVGDVTNRTDILTGGYSNLKYINMTGHLSSYPYGKRYIKLLKVK